MESTNIETLLKQVSEGTIDIEKAKEMLVQYQDMGFAKLDHHRHKRTGFHEVVYGEGKSAEQLISIISSLKQNINRVLATRIDEKKAAEVMNAVPDLTYNPVSRTLCWIHEDEPVVLYNGYIAIVCAGTSDLSVAEEAAVTAEVFGAEVKRIYDVGVAGIHRLFHHLDDIENATVTVAVAGMEGALPSVVGGLISNPIVAVPTSIGYGANFNGLSALLSMLNACAPGISVMNIDNGFGAGYYATLIHKNHYKNSRV
ncbi:nickel pincer cofactor biosynthesis protein LarB [Neobacillus sp. PS3-12]|jgi:pyridinium-3,5-biscarboxylic acid mononucleotide synthase|uniref:nickel pincer cofactor biosynthesis protein LarB n=1 Tax=Neobacillus sp. PS3-12 TaxID=3070677 RepID=UPI0027DF01A8|nr:nickel pincer cofactor biosynthesis protein LarB [Neobacillus sp. PS3-12]WML52564.1 nickel pincer cofactor biosynthesis protein LarB [Neobacillus sp. PS3-12]